MKGLDVIDAIEKMMKKLPPVRGKNAGVACVVGFIFGGIGLAVYFRNVVDVFIPLGVGLALMILARTDIGWLAGSVVAALYGYYRVQFSDLTEKLPQP
jgi:hypothetical protein